MLKLWMPVALLSICMSAAAPTRAAQPGETFRGCAECPEMVVIPAGSFSMGSPANEPGHDAKSRNGA